MSGWVQTGGLVASEAAALGALPRRARHTAVIALFVFAAGLILVCAKPFAESMIGAGTQLGVERFQQAMAALQRLSTALENIEQP